MSSPNARVRRTQPIGVTKSSRSRPRRSGRGDASWTRRRRPPSARPWRRTGYGFKQRKTTRPRCGPSSEPNSSSERGRDDPMKVTKTYFMLFATQMERTVGFYRDAFGLEVRRESPYWSELSWGDATIALHGREQAPSGETETGLGFEVDDLEAACKAVETAGGRVVEPPVDRPDEGIRLAR